MSIQLATLNDVTHAIRTFGGEVAPAALDENFRQIGESSGGMGFAMAAMALPRDGISFASQVAADAHHCLEREAREAEEKAMKKRAQKQVKQFRARMAKLGASPATIKVLLRWHRQMVREAKVRAALANLGLQRSTGDDE